MPHMRKVNLRDVARRADVSQTSVSRFFNDPAKLREPTRKRIAEAIAELDYVPSMTARALASSRSHTIGAIVPTFDHALFARELSDTAQYLSQAGYALMISSGNFEPAEEADLVRTMVSRNVDGLLLVGLERDPAIYALLDRKGIPYVTTWMIDPGSPYPQVGADNALAVRDMADHLLDLGHRDFGVLELPSTKNDRTRSRLAGIRTALEARGLSLTPEDIIETPVDYEAGAWSLRRFMERPKPPTAIMCGGDVFAIGMLLEAAKMGLSVPQDLSVTGFDNHGFSSMMVPALTSIDLAVRETGRLAAKYLLDRIAGQNPPRVQVASHSLILRDSTATPRRKL